MFEFGRFLWACIQKGFLVGNGAAAIVEFLCAILWAIGRFRKVEKGSMKLMEEKMNVWGKWALIIVFFCCTFILTFFS